MISCAAPLTDAGGTAVADADNSRRNFMKAGLAANATLPVDLMMVSHIDDDHIKGVLELTKEMIEAPGPKPLRINGLWHNTFDDIIGNNPDKLRAAVTASFGTASLSGDPEEVEGLDPEAQKVLASVFIMRKCY